MITCIRKKIAAYAAAFVLAFSAMAAPAAYTNGTTVYAEAYTDSVSGIKCTLKTDSAELSWNGLSSAKSYKVEIKTENGKYKKVDCNFSKNFEGKITANVTGLEAGKKYTVRITPLKRQGTKYIEGKAKTVSITAKGGKTSSSSSSSSASKLKRPDKFSSKFKLTGKKDNETDITYYYTYNSGTPGVVALDDCAEDAINAFTSFVKNAEKLGYKYEFQTESDEFAKDGGITLIKIFKNNVSVAAIAIYIDPSDGFSYVYLERKKESIANAVKDRVPHPDEYKNSGMTFKSSAILPNDIKMFAFTFEKANGFDTYVKNIAADGFKCEKYVNDQGVEMYDISYNGVHTGTASYYEENGVYTIMICYK